LFFMFPVDHLLDISEQPLLFAGDARPQLQLELHQRGVLLRQPRRAATALLHRGELELRRSPQVLQGGEDLELVSIERMARVGDDVGCGFIAREKRGQQRGEEGGLEGKSGVSSEARRAAARGTAV
jgi:hypothetical protein